MIFHSFRKLFSSCSISYLNTVRQTYLRLHLYLCSVACHCFFVQTVYSSVICLKYLLILAVVLYCSVTWKIVLKINLKKKSWIMIHSEKSIYFFLWYFCHLTYIFTLNRWPNYYYYNYLLTTVYWILFCGTVVQNKKVDLNKKYIYFFIKIEIKNK